MEVDLVLCQILVYIWKLLFHYSALTAMRLLILLCIFMNLELPDCGGAISCNLRIGTVKNCKSGCSCGIITVVSSCVISTASFCFTVPRWLFLVCLILSLHWTDSLAKGKLDWIVSVSVFSWRSESCSWFILYYCFNS